MNTNMEQYYAQRAAEYDRIYDKPERQNELAELKSILSRGFFDRKGSGLDVLEIACGTGYWTQYIARSAASILATDYNQEVIDLARKRDYGQCRVSFKLADAYSLADIPSGFSAGFCGFWWSHIPINRRLEFLTAFHSHLVSGARVIMIDGRYVEGSSTPIARKDKSGNTYQIRHLDDGSTHEVIKNYPAESELKADFEKFAVDLKITLLQYFWMIDYRTR
jgi:demethylmenaquinone methyltransferase/2-methoxy-6-polyprenyl-1,4-benzoquinol methylase